MQTLAQILAGVSGDPTQVNPGLAPLLAQQSLLQGAQAQQAQQPMQQGIPGINQPLSPQSSGMLPSGVGGNNQLPLGLGLALGLY